MANNFGANESITGYITNVSNENKKKKYFLKFTMLSENNHMIDGWVFSSITGILTTPLGIALRDSIKNKTGIKLWGSIEHNPDTSIFRMQSWSKFQAVNLNFELQTPSNDVISIREALMSVELNSIKVYIINIGPSEEFNNQGITRTTTFILVGDETGTTYLIATDLAPDTIQVAQSYKITKIRKKMLNDSSILSTTIDTNISLSNSVVIPDVNDVDSTMNIDFTDNKKITTTIAEVAEIKRIWSCMTCNGNLNEVVGVPSLLLCHKCHRHTLKININQTISTTIVLKNAQQKIILLVNHESFNKLLDIIGFNINMLDTDIIIALMTTGNLTFEYSELRKQLLNVSKP